MAEVWKLTNRKNAAVFFVSDEDLAKIKSAGMERRYFIEKATADKKGEATVTAEPKRIK